MQSWQHALQSGFSNVGALLSYLQIPQQAVTVAAETPFPFKVTRHFAEQMQIGNPKDPLLLQVLPMQVENMPNRDFVPDPLAEQQANVIPGLLHRYQSRVLLILNTSCAIHCRYCFRREFDYQTNRPSKQAWYKAFQYIQAHPEINEVILSGGDPLIHKDAFLDFVLSELASIPHIDTCRIHSRLPIVLPQRLTPELQTTLSNTRLKIVLVIHSNHANELSSLVQSQLQAFSDSNMMLLNQAVLLKDINDNVEALFDLSHVLFQSGVLPYYLHLLDPVTGAAHFDVPESEGQSLMRRLAERLPGYLLPKLCRDVPGAPNKRLIHY